MSERDTQAASIVDALRWPALLSAGFALVGSVMGRNAARSQGRLEWLGVFTITFGLLYGGTFAVTTAAGMIDREWRRRST